MRTRLVVGGAVGLAVAAAAVTAAFVLPAQAGPEPSVGVGIGKVTHGQDEVKERIRQGQLVDPPQASDPTFNPEPTSPPR